MSADQPIPADDQPVPVPDPPPDAAPPAPDAPPLPSGAWSAAVRSAYGPTQSFDPSRIRGLHRSAAGAPDPSPAGALPAPGPGRAPAGGPTGSAAASGDERRRHRFVGVAVLSVLVLLLGATGLVLLPRDPAADGAGGDRGADLATADGEGPDAGEIDVEVDSEATLPGFALGDETGSEAFLDDILVDGEWSGGATPNPGAGDPTAPPQPQPQPQPQPDDEGGGGEVGEPQDQSEPGNPTPDPTPDPTPSDPCSTLGPGAHLVTTPDPAHLNPGVMASSLTIRNCDTDAVNWTAATKPSVSLSAGSGTLAGGATQLLGFTIDSSAFGGDAIAFKIKVSEPGSNQYVDIDATKSGLTTPDPTPDPGATLSDGGPTGCSAQCITRAWLTPNASTPNLDLAVESTTAARFAVFVSTAAPVNDPDGQPSFPEGGLIAATADLNTAWHASLAPLEAATDYHIVVRATDADGGVANRVGTFRTVAPAVDPGLDEAAPGGDSGCATQCITKAWLTPEASSFDMRLEVTSHTLARFEASVSTDAPVLDEEGHPTFPGLAPMTTNFAYETSWDSVLGPLEPGTRYTVIVRATDGMLRSSYRVGSFETRPGADQMMVTLHEIRVSNDGDNTGKGELTFSMVINGNWVAGAGEHKIASGTTVNMSDGDRYPGISRWVDFQEGPGSWLPSLAVVAFERDGDGLVEVCSGGVAPAAATGHDDGCDWKWNTAGTGLIQSVGHLVPCPELGIDAVEVAGDRCVAFESTDEGDDVPRFSAVASFRAVTT